MYEDKCGINTSIKQTNPREHSSSIITFSYTLLFLLFIPNPPRSYISRSNVLNCNSTPHHRQVSSIHPKPIMSAPFPTRPAFIHHGCWSPTTRSHPALAFLEEYSASHFDARAWDTAHFSEWHHEGWELTVCIFLISSGVSVR